MVASRERVTVKVADAASVRDIWRIIDTVNVAGAASERYSVNARDNATVKVALTANARYVCRTIDTVNVALTAIV